MSWAAILKGMTAGLLLLAVSACAGCGGSSSATPAAPTPAACAVSVPGSLSVAAAAGASSITVTAGSGCAWAATTNAAFIAITSGASGSGTGFVSFTVAANTGAARVGVVTIGGQAVSVNQAAGTAGSPGLAFAPPSPPDGLVGVVYGFSVATATGGVEPIHYQLDSGGGFPPLGLVLGTNGSVTGTPIIAGSSTASFCAVDATGASKCQPVTITVREDPVIGLWGGNTTLTTGCPGFAGLTNAWTGTVRRNAANGVEIVINSPGLAISNEVESVTLTGTQITFTSALPALVHFVATLSADRLSISNGTFAGPSIDPTCAPSSGAWTGAHR